MKKKTKHIRKSALLNCDLDMMLALKWENEDFNKLVIMFQRLLRQQKNVTAEKLANWSQRLLSVSMCKMRTPLLVIYLTQAGMRQANANDAAWARTIHNNVDGKYIVLILPCLHDEDVRAEIWCRGSLAYMRKQEAI